MVLPNNPSQKGGAECDSTVAGVPRPACLHQAAGWSRNAEVSLLSSNLIPLNIAQGKGGLVHERRKEGGNGRLLLLPWTPCDIGLAPLQRLLSPVWGEAPESCVVGDSLLQAPSPGEFCQPHRCQNRKVCLSLMDIGGWFHRRKWDKNFVGLLRA